MFDKILRKKLSHNIIMTYLLKQDKNSESVLANDFRNQAKRMCLSHEARGNKEGQTLFAVGLFLRFLRFQISVISFIYNFSKICTVVRLPMSISYQSKTVHCNSDGSKSEIRLLKVVF